MDPLMLVAPAGMGPVTEGAAGVTTTALETAEVWPPDVTVAVMDSPPARPEMPLSVQEVPETGMGDPKATPFL